MAQCNPGGGGGSRGALDEEDVLAGAIARVEVRRAAVDGDELLRLFTNMSDYVGLNRIKIGLKSD